MNRITTLLLGIDQGSATYGRIRPPRQNHMHRSRFIKL